MTTLGNHVEVDSSGVSRAPWSPLSSEATVSTELSARRTGMSFQRTRMSAERTLMSVIRTALSMIGFGFSIFQFFVHLKQSQLLRDSSHSPMRFGLSLVALGIGMLASGITYHLLYMRGLRAERKNMIAEGLIHGESQYPISFTLIIASLLLVLGIVAIISMALDRAVLH